MDKIAVEFTPAQLIALRAFIGRAGSVDEKREFFLERIRSGAFPEDSRLEYVKSGQWERDYDGAFAALREAHSKAGLPNVTPAPKPPLKVAGEKVTEITATSVKVGCTTVSKDEALAVLAVMEQADEDSDA